MELLSLLVGHYLAVTCEWSDLFGKKLSGEPPKNLREIEIQSDGESFLRIPSWRRFEFSNFGEKSKTKSNDDGGCCYHTSESKFKKWGLEMKKNHYHNLWCIPRLTYFSAKDSYKIRVISKTEIIVEYAGENYPDAKCTYRRLDSVLNN